MVRTDDIGILREWDVRGELKKYNQMKPRSLDEHIRKWIEGEIIDLMGYLSYIVQGVESPIEAIVYMELWKNARTYEMQTKRQVIVSPQVDVGPYRVDFLVVWNDRKTIVECDGHDFHEKTKEQAAHDKKRDRELRMLGYTVLRYTGSEITKDPHKIWEDLYRVSDDDYAALFVEA